MIRANDACTLDVAGLLFDLDGVLADSTLAVEKVWREFAARHGLDADALMTGLHGRRMIDTLASALPGISSDELRVESDRLVGTVADLSVEPHRSGLRIALACRRAGHLAATGDPGHLHRPVADP